VRVSVINQTTLLMTDSPVYNLIFYTIFSATSSLLNFGTLSF
jgi:hypothetical protein